MHSSTIALRKLGKGDNFAPAAWQPVAMLNTLGNVLEIIVASKITVLSEEHCLLPPQHMGAQSERSIDTALDMPFKQIHAPCQANNGIASLLHLDMTRAIDQVVPVQLIYYLKKSYVPQWLVCFIFTLLSDSSTSLSFPGFAFSPIISEQGDP